MDNASPSSNPGATEIRRKLTMLLALNRRRGRAQIAELAALSQALVEAEAAEGRDWDDQAAGELAALLAEYESVRAESMQTISNRTQIMMLGVAAMGALIGGALTINTPTVAPNRLIVQAVFSGAVPLVFLFVFFMWLSEAVRAHRAGYFLAADVEARINIRLGRLVSTWETSLWTARLPRDEMFGPSMMAILVMAWFAALAPPFGLVMSGVTDVVSVETSVLIGVPYLSFVLAALYARRNLARLKNIPVLQSTFPEADAG